MDIGTIHMSKENIYVDIKSFFGEAHIARLNWLKMFNAANSLYIGAYTFVDKYPYDEGCGIHMFKIDTKTGRFTQLINLLEEHEIFSEEGE